MAKEVEKYEALFRRHLAIEPLGQKRRRAIAKITPIRSLAPVSPTFREEDAAVSNKLWTALNEPQRSLLPSAGNFNVARVPANAAVWMIVVGEIERAKFESFVLDTCNAQSAEKSFRPLFVLSDDSQIEVMRRFGLSFEVLSAPSFAGLSHEQQIERYIRKWGCSLKLMVGRLIQEAQTPVRGTRNAAVETMDRQRLRKVASTRG